MLGKLRLPDTPTAHKVQELALLLRHLVEVSGRDLARRVALMVLQRHPMGDVASRNAVTRFENGLKKKYGELLGEMDEESLRINGDLKEVWEFIDDR